MPLSGEPLPISESNASVSTQGVEALMELLLDLNAANETDKTWVPPHEDQTVDEPILKEVSQNGAVQSASFWVSSEETNYLKYAHQVAHDQAHHKYQAPLNASRTSAVKSSPETDLRALVDRLESKLNHLEHQIYEPTELINPLIPLMTELLTLQGVGSGESMLQALTPIIDQALTIRFQQDRERMSAALGQILPEAIAQEIRESPSAIANAIAPELAAALQEQIRLDHRSIAETLGPQMGEAIKQQIVVERDAMVDALYPVIGNTISKYMGEVVQSINQKVETVLSFEGISRKIRARLQGVSEAELILKEAVGCRVQSILLIHKTSGLVIRNLQVAPDFKLEAEMWAGMLTAIRSFVNECVAQPGKVSELHVIAYDDSKIILEVAGYCYVAAVVRGEPSKPFVSKIRQTLSQIILKQGRAIAAYNGEPGKIPNEVDVLLAQLVQQEPNVAHPKKLFGLSTLLGISLISLVFMLYRSMVASNIETKTSKILDVTPELSIYRLEPKVHFGKLTLSGRVPNVQLKDKADKIVRQTAPNWSFENQIVAIEIPPDPVIAAGEIERLTWLFNQKDGIAITTQHDYDTQTIRVTGVTAESKDLEQFIQALKKIPGVLTVISTVQTRPFLKTRFYFESGSMQIQNSDGHSKLINSKLIAIRKFLDQNPGIQLKIIGHSDPTGEKNKNKELGLGRAHTIKDALIAEGVEPDRLQVVGVANLPPDTTNIQPLKLSRCVRFEVTIPK
jgi:outer membrane protein OmpA-like peptidoglycan-associated protein